jgi:hypothetical protein
VGSLKSHWETYGAKWIFIVYGVSSAMSGRTYLESCGASFGWATTDEDNSEGAYTVLYSGMFTNIPWISAIRTSDMQLTHAESGYSDMDIRSVAMELASD